MTDKPIIFSAPMVRALLAGTKTQTRRILKPQPPEWVTRMTHEGRCGWIGSGDGHGTLMHAPCAVGDRLWVREALICATENMGKFASFADVVCYAEDGSTALREFQMVNWPWKRETLNVRFMPRWASRLTLIVTDVRVQRVQSITEADAVEEGVSPISEPDDRKWEHYAPHGVAFRALWNSLHGPGAWDANPWVAALTFTVHRQNIDQMEPTK